MKKHIDNIWHHRGLKTLCVLGMAFLVGGAAANAGEIFNTDFSKGKIDELGWVAKGDWQMKDFGADKPGLAKNPGPVMKFPANGTTNGTLIKKFDPIANPASLKLTFDGGYGWGAKDHAQGIGIMLLDADGNGYLFNQQRANATWGAQWDVVTKYAHNDQEHWAPAAIDATQAAVVDGGGLLTFTITYDGKGNWTFNRDGWNTPLTFTDKTTTTFSQVVLMGTPNNDDLLFNKVKLEVTK